MLRITAAALVATCLALPASAQSVCGERDKFIDHLGSNYQEGPVAMGLVSNGSVLEVLASKGGSWTIIVTHPDGNACVVATGESWEDLPTLVAGPSA
jgi:hypothetical protein